MVAVETSRFETPEEAVAALSHTAEDPELSPPAINGTHLYEKHVSPGKCSCDPSPLGREGQAPAGRRPFRLKLRISFGLRAY